MKTSTVSWHPPPEGITLIIAASVGCTGNTMFIVSVAYEQNNTASVSRPPQNYKQQVCVINCYQSASMVCRFDVFS